MKPGVQVLFGSQPVLFQNSRYRFPVEPLDANRIVIDQSRRAFVVERDDGSYHPKPHDLVRFVLTHHGQTEHILIEGRRSRQVCNLNADVVDLGPFETTVLHRSRRHTRSAGEHRETVNQFPAGESAGFEAFHQVGNDGFHVNLLDASLLHHGASIRNECRIWNMKVDVQRRTVFLRWIPLSTRRGPPPCVVQPVSTGSPS